MKYVFILLTIFIYQVSMAQTNICFNTQTNSSLKSSAIASDCGVSINYSVYPYPNYTPIKTVRISFHVFEKSDGSGSYNGSQSAVTSYFQLLIDSMNYRHANIQTLTPTVTSPKVPDTKVRFVLNKVYFHTDDNLYIAMAWRRSGYNPYYAPADSVYNNVILTDPNLSSVDKVNTLHVILFPNSIGCCAGEAESIPSKKWILMLGYDYAYNWGTSPVREVLSHIIHETGHCLGLYHNFQGGNNGYQCDDCADDGCPIQGTSNNYMDYSYLYFSGFSECQIAKMHYYLMGNANYGDDISDDYVQDYCIYDNSQTISINSGQNITWKSSKNLKGNLIINSGGSLTIECSISIPVGGQVTVNSGGKLILNQGVFHNSCSNSWTGIFVQNGGYLEINSSTISDYNVEVQSGGTLRISDNLTITGSNHIDIESGGFICVDNTAAINLQDPLSFINFHYGFNFGVNTAFITNPGTCISNVASINKTGLGSINSYNADLYIQNITVSTSQYFLGERIFAGSNVTSANPPGVGNVIFQSGANIIFDSNGNILLDKGFNVQSGASFQTILNNH